MDIEKKKTEKLSQTATGSSETQQIYDWDLRLEDWEHWKMITLIHNIRRVDIFNLGSRPTPLKSRLGPFIRNIL